MARTQHLPLYASAYVFAREIYRIRIKLPRALKYDIGGDAFGSSIRMIKFITLANRSHDKGMWIGRLLLEIEVQWVFLRLLHDLRGISSGELKVLSERLADIGRQAQAWHKWSQERPARHPQGIAK